MRSRNISFIINNLKFRISSIMKLILLIFTIIRSKLRSINPKNGCFCLIKIIKLRFLQAYCIPKLKKLPPFLVSILRIILFRVSQKKKKKKKAIKMITFSMLKLIKKSIKSGIYCTRVIN